MQEAGGEDREKHSEQRQRERAVRSSAGLEARSLGGTGEQVGLCTSQETKVKRWAQGPS